MALAGGVDAVQLRERDLSARELHDLALKLRAITRKAGAALIVNQRLDVALAAGADGVHLGWRSLNPAAVRKLAGEKFLIGISCHDGPQIHSAEETRANYALLGPVFHTPSKEGLVYADRDRPSEGPGLRRENPHPRHRRHYAGERRAGDGDRRRRHRRDLRAD